MPAAATLEEHLQTLDEAPVGSDDLRAAIEQDCEEMGPAARFFDEVDAGGRAPRERSAAGSHRFADQGLHVSAPVAQQSSHFLPFQQLLARIDAIHRKGLGAEG